MIRINIIALSQQLQVRKHSERMPFLRANGKINIPANVNYNYRWSRWKNDETCKSYEKVEIFADRPVLQENVYSLRITSLI